MNIEIIQEDITNLNTKAIVNPKTAYPALIAIVASEKKLTKYKSTGLKINRRNIAPLVGGTFLLPLIIA